VVRWTHEGAHFVQSTPESTKVAFDLFKQYGEAISDLEVRRSSLEDTYLALVKQAESGQHPAVLEEVAR
jgi:ABC-2 type transport system ATP-binding protein